MIKDKFWMVWDRQEETATGTHNSLSGATLLAEKLAQRQPGKVFEVFEVVEAREAKVAYQMQVITYEPPVPC